jgi:hypothetical protein
MAASWSGTQSEYLDLMRVLNRNCGCQFGLMGVRLSRCSTHDLIDDQRVLNGLVYARRIAATLRDEESLAPRLRPRIRWTSECAERAA